MEASTAAVADCAGRGGCNVVANFGIGLCPPQGFDDDDDLLAGNRVYCAV